MTRPSRADLIQAMRASSLPAPQRLGLWQIQRKDAQDIAIEELATWVLQTYGYARFPDLAPITTTLYRWTDATLHQPDGECVMSDDPRELCRHLPAVLRASGRVLVTGLGLGCVVRGLLRNQAVAHIDVVEIDRDVLAMVGPSLAGEPRVTLHEGDALTYAWPTGTRWDLCWHDVWSESPGTQVVHAQLLLRYRELARQQGAWGFPRFCSRLLRALPLVNGPRRRREAAA